MSLEDMTRELLRRTLAAEARAVPMPTPAAVKDDLLVY